MKIVSGDGDINAFTNIREIVTINYWNIVMLTEEKQKST